MLDLVRSHVPTLQRLGLATDRAPMLMRGATGTLVEAFEWVSAAAIEQAHSHPEVRSMWDRFAALCEFQTLAQLSEAGQMFAEFEAL